MNGRCLVDESKDPAALEEELWQRAQELYGGAGGSVDLSEDEAAKNEELWQKALEQLRQASSPGDKEAGLSGGTADLSDEEVWDAYELSHWNATADPEPGVEGGNIQRVAAEPSDDELWQSYVELQDGTTGRRRALENAQWEQREREEEWVEYCKHSGSPLPTHMEHLRPRLKGYGY